MYSFVNKAHLNSPFSIPGAMLSTTNSTSSTNNTSSTSNTSNISSTSTAIHHHHPPPPPMSMMPPGPMDVQQMAAPGTTASPRVYEPTSNTQEPFLHAVLITLSNTHLSPHIDSPH